MHPLLGAWLYSFLDSTTGHLLLAVFLGILIGIEREWRQRSAGLRTNALVCLGAAGFVDLGVQLTHLPVSISQLIAYVISGVGFLGAGAIMKEGAAIRGLNTAATLWCSAAVGATAAAGKAHTAFLLAAIVIAVNLCLRPITMYIDRISGNDFAETQVSYVIRLKCADRHEEELRAQLLKGITEMSLTLYELESQNTDQPGVVEITAHVTGSARNDHALERLSGRLSLQPSVTAVRWSVVVSSET